MTTFHFMTVMLHECYKRELSENALNKGFEGYYKNVKSVINFT